MLSRIKHLALFLCFNAIIFSQVVPPSDFEYTQSTFQAFYFFHDTYDGEGNHLEPSDWVGAFKGDVCVGSIQWDVAQCGEGICAVPVMGDDGSDWTSDYMNTGDIPTFKIYDTSTDMYHDANPSGCLLYTSPSPRDVEESRMPSSA